MFIIEASRRVSRVSVERIRDALIEYDHIAFKEVQLDVPAEQAFQVVREGRTYVLAFEDPSLEQFEPLEADCGS